MVFQRNMALTIFGNDTAGSTVTVQFPSGSYKATTGADGLFSVALPAQPLTASPFAVSVTSSAGGSITLSDVLVGDVILCSGQSNMGLQVAQTVNHSLVAAASDAYGPMLRYLNVAPMQSYINVTTPQWGEEQR
jgi:sialate O-acetylesterase